jgi:hypothetical protein
MDTGVNETLVSLTNRDILRIIGNGWHPRTVTFEIIQEDGNRVKVEGERNLKRIVTEITKFFSAEPEDD